MAEKAKRSESRIRFGVEFDGKPDGDIQLTAYAFDGRGTFLGAAPVRQGVAELGLRGEAAASARIFFGPQLRDQEAKPTIEAMERIAAYEPAWRFDPRLDIQKLLPIPSDVYQFWPICSCRVRGQVVRPVKIGSVTVKYPVQNARVHICEVDKIHWWIERLPDYDLFRLRDELLEKLRERIPFPFPIPLPDPPPYEVFLKTPIEVGGPSPLDLVGLNPQPLPPREFDQVMLNPQPLPPRQMMMSRMDRVALNPQPLPPKEMTLFDSLPGAVQIALQAESVGVIRQTLIDHATLFSPLWCHFHWLHTWLTCDELVVVETDGQGRFDTTILYRCWGDHPDLYFWVEYFINGQWVTVYDPGRACHTYWNYVCGSEVTITITDPRVPGIPGGVDLGFKGLLVTTIGSGVCVKDVPTSGAGVGLFGDAPFGATLDLRADFGMTDLRAAGIIYYLWSYKRLTASDGVTAVSDSWHPFTEEVIRHYQFPPPNPWSGPNYVAYPLKKPNGLYEIPPTLIPGAIRMATISEADLATGYFVTPGSSGSNPDAVAGLYALKLELFDSGGNAINWTAEGVDVFIPNISAPLNTSFGTHHAPISNRILGGPSGTDTLAFQMVVRVDNNPVVAVLHTVELNGSPANPNCGFLEYTNATSDLVNLSFQAYHPHGFAIFGNGVYRGLGVGLPSANASGKVTDTNASNPAGINGYNRVGNGEYSKSIPVGTLLAENTAPPMTPCSQAAFSQNLGVYAMAINGYGRLEHLDRGGVQAFALAQQ